MTNVTMTIEEVEAELARTGQVLAELEAAVADIADVEVTLGDEALELFERLSALGVNDAPVMPLPLFSIAV